jgi:hypothetical protein
VHEELKASTADTPAYTPGEIAPKLGVSRWTIWRDVRALMHPDPAPDCPACALWARVLR